MLIWIHFAVLFGVAIAVTAALVPLVRRFAIAHDVVDHPGGRRVNKEPIPRLGGLAMFGGLLAAFLLEYIFEACGIWQGPLIIYGGVNFRLIGAFIGLACIVIIGTIDDFVAMPALLKFIGQIAAACIIVFSGSLLENIKIPFGNEVINLGLWAYPISILYLVAFANVINLIDGLDGLAAGVTAISGITMFVLTATLLRADAAIIAIILVGICIGFLFYNFHPASIFMGDSGSLLLGMTLGTVSLLGAARFTSITALAVPIIIAGVPVIDTLGAIIRRLRGHKSISAADADHIHHKLLRQGFSQKKAVLIIYAWTAILSAAACLAWNLGGLLKYGVLILVFVVSAIIIWRLGLFGPVLQHHFFPRNKNTSSVASKPENTSANSEKSAFEEQSPGSASPGDVSSEAHFQKTALTSENSLDNSASAQDVANNARKN